MQFGADTAIIVTISGLLIVFSVLVLLVGIIKLFGVAFSGGKPKSEQKPIAKKTSEQKSEPSAPVVCVADDDEVIAVISAAVYAYSQSENKNYRIKSVKPAKSERVVRPAWAAAGIVQNTNPF